MRWFWSGSLPLTRATKETTQARERIATSALGQKLTLISAARVSGSRNNQTYR